MMRMLSSRAESRPDQIAVIERHKRTGKRGIGILEGYGLTEGP